MSVPETAPTASGVAQYRPAMITAEQVADLQALRAYPSISLLANTRPGERMHANDIGTLRGLVDEAGRRLAAEQVEDRRLLVEHLARMVDEAADQPTARAVGLYASADRCARVDLPVPVINRCVIDPTFATRDLVRALHHTPRHAVLLLSADRARLLIAHGSSLTRTTMSAFPIRRRTDDGKDRGRAEPQTEFLRRVDRALGAALRLNPMPLVLVAAEPTASTFRRLSKNTARLAGVVKGHHLSSPAGALVELIAPIMRDYLRSRADEALALIERRADGGRVLSDIQEAWLAARWERPEMLAVEEDYFYPARLDSVGDGLIPAEDVDHPDIIDDVVDELIEIVLSRGGWIALLEPGRLPAGGHLALTLRPR